MRLAVNRWQVLNELQVRFSYLPADAQKILQDLESGGVVEFAGAMATLLQPTSPDAIYVKSLLNISMGKTVTAVSQEKIREYLNLCLRRVETRGSAVRV
ncbi:hypothetical protein RAS1_17690 [Phycisphaerae bacterium RAS1]|nr:hypothetical protein RAS1_17690 [Phycisphaerae bacterium RAS1]